MKANTNMFSGECNMDHLSIKTSLLVKFKKDNPRKVDLANKLLSLSGTVFDIFLNIFENPCQYLLIQDIFRNFQESLLFSMRGEPQSAFSMARISSEASRNLFRILEDPTLAELFTKGRENKENRKRWRKEFKFKEDEKLLLKLYNIGSDYGIHATGIVPDRSTKITARAGMPVTALSQKEHSKKAFIMVIVALHWTMFQLVNLASKEIEKNEDSIALAVVFKEEWSKLGVEVSKQKRILSKNRMH
jgi:hypothetical protein